MLTHRMWSLTLTYNIYMHNKNIFLQISFHSMNFKINFKKIGEMKIQPYRRFNVILLVYCSFGMPNLVIIYDFVIVPAPKHRYRSNLLRNISRCTSIYTILPYLQNRIETLRPILTAIASTDKAVAPHGLATFRDTICHVCRRILYANDIAERCVVVFPYHKRSSFTQYVEWSRRGPLEGICAFFSLRAT